jgi:hypothetical protein
MASGIDPTKPEEGSAKTKNVRDNFSAAKNEIETLQSKAANLDGSGNFADGTVSNLSDPVAIIDGGTGADTASGARSNLGVSLSNLGLVGGSFTLNTSGTTTTVSDSNVKSGSHILLFPRDAGAASVEGIGAYVSSVTDGTSFTVTHADFSGTRTYDYLVLD